MYDDLLTASELAQLLGVRPATIRQWAREEIIPAIRISRKVLRFCYGDVRASLRESPFEWNPENVKSYREWMSQRNSEGTEHD